MQIKGLSGSTLKLIALITMLIDHIGATILARELIAVQWTQTLYWVYRAMRMVGRIAFPIYCFLLVEGFLHTRDRKKYALRLLLFALISEVPFDLAFSGKLLEFGYQNVFFTLFIGLITMMAVQTVEERENWNPWMRCVGLLVTGAAGMLLAYFMQTDYDAIGVLCILALYLFRQTRGMQILAGCIAFGSFELPALVAFIPIAFYNGKRGADFKYLFYIFYPLHLFVLYFICRCMGIAGISVI